MRGSDAADGAEDSDSLDRLRAGWKRTETRRGELWNVQPVSAVRATKVYVCPGCEAKIDIGSPHLVAWRADGVLGDQADVAARRHWHKHCWSAA